MACETGCREVQLIQIELQEVWKEFDILKSQLSSLQTDSVRAEERQIALEKSLTALTNTIDKMSIRLDKQLDSIVTEIKNMNIEVQRAKTRAEFTITWKEITAVVAGLMVLGNAAITFFGG